PFRHENQVPFQFRGETAWFGSHSIPPSEKEHEPMTTTIAGFRPLEEVICHDDFDTGMNGWMPLTPNLRQDAMDYFPSQERHKDWGAPMLSSATFGLAGTHGSRTGVYSLKIPTRPVAAPAEQLPV